MHSECYSLPKHQTYWGMMPTRSSDEEKGLTKRDLPLAKMSTIPPTDIPTLILAATLSLGDRLRTEEYASQAATPSVLSPPSFRALI